MMIIYIAGLQSIPGDVMEAAQIDGARKMDKIIQSHDSNDDAIHYHLYVLITDKRI